MTDENNANLATNQAHLRGYNMLGDEEKAKLDLEVKPRKAEWEEKILPMLSRFHASPNFKPSPFSDFLDTKNGMAKANFNLSPVMVRRAYLETPSVWEKDVYRNITDPNDPGVKNARFSIELWVPKAVAQEFTKNFLIPFYNGVLAHKDYKKGALPLKYSPDAFVNPPTRRPDSSKDLAYGSHEDTFFSIIKLKGFPLAYQADSSKPSTFNTFTLKRLRKGEATLIRPEDVKAGDIVKVYGTASQYTQTLSLNEKEGGVTQTFGISLYMNQGARLGLHQLVPTLDDGVWMSEAGGYDGEPIDDEAGELLESINSEQTAKRAESAGFAEDDLPF